MSDLISREDAINAIYHHFPHVSMERATEILHECETAEIIRCKDCLMHGVCRFEQGLGLEGYCSQAERKEE